MFEVTVPTKPLDIVLDRIAHRVGNLEPLMAGIAMELLDHTEQNFDQEGRPAWPELLATTKKARERQGHWPGKMLQVSGALARSAHTDHGHDYALIATGADIPYAALQQWGGLGGNGATLPPRPYFPVTGTPDDAQLGPEVQESILDLALDYLRKAGQ